MQVLVVLLVHYCSVEPEPPFVPALWFMRVDNGMHQIGQLGLSSWSCLLATELLLTFPLVQAGEDVLITAQRGSFSSWPWAPYVSGLFLFLNVFTSLGDFGFWRGCEKSLHLGHGKKGVVDL